MTSEKLHDALSLLPADLVAELRPRSLRCIGSAGRPWPLVSR